MAFDDETIRITVEGAQAQAQLDALAKEVRELELELKMLNSTAGVTSVEIEGTTRRLGQARMKFAEASEAAKTFEQRATGATLSVKEMTKSIGAGISIISILQQNLRDLEPVLTKGGEAMKFAAVQGGANAETMDNLGRALDSLLHPSRIAKNAIESVSIAWQKLIDGMVPGAEVVTHNVKTIADSLKLLDEARKASAEENKTSKKEEEDAAKALAKEEEALEIAAVKSAEARAAAEQKAAEEVVAALEKERIALDAKLAQDEARLAASLAKGSKLDDSTDTTDAQKNLENLRREIEKLEATTGLAPEQVNRLYEMKDAAAKLGREVSDLNNVFTVGNEDFLDQAQAADAASAAWDVYRTRLEQAQNRHEKANAAIEDSGDVLDELGETADEAGESLEDAADAAGELGDEAKKGADKAKEGLAGLKEGAEEAIPLLETIKGLLAEIKQAASEVDL